MTKHSEQAVDDLLAAMLATERAFAARTVELSREPGWSGVTFEVAPSEWRSSEKPDAQRWRGITGYVDGECANVGGVAWIVDVIRDGRRWKVERGLHLNRNTTNYQEKVAELPSVVCGDSGELARKLPRLIQELLDVPPPDVE